MGTGKIEDLYRLSPIQQGILFHTLRAPQSGTYFEQFSLRYDGGFDPEPFVAAWQAVVDRHPVLRTAFQWENLDEPVQGVHRAAEVPVDRKDWRQHDPAAQSQRLAAYVAADRRRGFRLTRPPLLRLALLRLDDDAYQVVWSYHHLVLDGWSAGLVMHEVATAYQALRAGEPLPSAVDRRPYRDYLAWLRHRPLDQAEDFWRHALAGFEGPTPLGIDQGTAALSEAAAGRQTEAGWALDLARLSERESAALKTFAQRHRLTLNTVVQGAWALVLAHYSGRSDVVFGITVSGRPPALSGSERMVGCFINTLPLRLAVPAGAELVPWLEEVQRRQVAVRRFEHTPLAQVIRWSGTVPRQDLFSSILVFESFTVDAAFEMTHTGVFQRTNYPLTLVVAPDREMAIRLGYDRRRFAAADIARLQGHLRTLLGAMPRSARRVLGTLPLLSADERRQILEDWNDTASPVDDTSIVDRMAARAAATPQALAVCDRLNALSYAELLRQVGRLAHELQARGVGPEVRVALCLDRSCGLVVAVLAVLAAGGAYVPLDPSHPPRRLVHVLRDAGAVLVLAEARTRARAEALVAELAAAPDVVLVEAATATPAGKSSGLPPDRAQPSNLAYLIYTSGSTGLPKGVGIPRRALTNFLDAMHRRPGLGPRDVLVAVTTLAFDIAALELLLPPVVGAQVVIADTEQARDPAVLRALLRASKATVMQATPATWRLLVAADENGDSPAAGDASWRDLRALAGGEPLPPDLAATLVSRVDSLWNLYGPTETTIWSSRARIDDPQAITIGRPIENTVIRLVDAALRPVPVGVAGEIWIGGTGLARGYVGQPARTAERFVPDSLGTVPGARLYRTGDLGRWRADGALECLGRIDHQLKIRGFRIEPGEIEHALADIDPIREAVAMAVPAADGEPRLIAFVVPEKDAVVPAADTLRERLAATLPGYMIPGSFLALDRLPMTPNGKVDRRALAARVARGDEHRPALEGPHVAPRTDLERTLVSLFEAVLERRPVGIEDSFFDLGGHSLLAVRLVGRMRKHVGRPVPLDVLLRNDTVARLAKAIEAPQIEEPQDAAGNVLVKLAAGAPGWRPFFAVHPIGGEVRCYAPLAERLPPERPFYALRTPDQPPRFDSLRAMAAHYVEVLRQAQPRGPYSLGGWSMGGVVAFEMACQLQAAGETLAQLWLLDARLPDRLGLRGELPPSERIALFARDLAGIAGTAGEALADAVRQAATDDALGVAMARAKALELLPAELELADVEAHFARFEANLDALRGYTPRRFPGALTLVRASARLTTDLDDDPTLGWGRWAAGGVEVLQLGCHHFSLLRPPAVDRLAAQLTLRLAGRHADHALA